MGETERYDDVQARKDHDPSSFVVKGEGVYTIAAIIGQDGGRSTPLLSKTLLAKISFNGKMTPFIDEGATNGTAIPAGIYMGSDIPAADIVAGDITGVVVLLSDAWFDDGKLVIEASKTLDTNIIIGNDVRTVGDRLRSLGLIPVLTESNTDPENS